MEPVEKLPPQNGAEMNHVERAPDLTSARTERQEAAPVLDAGAEKAELAAEASAAAADSGFPATLPMPVASTPVVPSPAGTGTPTAVTSGSTLVADDADLIEKEWVDRAKKIVDETRSDPYTREEAVSELKTEYKQKRYGRGPGEA